MTFKWKKHLTALAAASLTLGMLALPAQAAETVWPNPAQVTVDGQAVTFDAYTVYGAGGGTTYCKLRDVAMALSGSGSQFEVSWDGAHNRVCLTTGGHYTAVGGELHSGHHDHQQHHSTGTHSSCDLYLDGQSVSVDAYLIGQNHYCKLRDLGTLLNFGVDWDQSSQTIRITSSNADATAQTAEVVRLVNEVRAQAGLPALSTLPELDEAAQVRAAEAAECFSHDRPDGTICFTVLDQCGISGYWRCGENIAMGNTTADRIMDQWMNSESHRQNILNPDYTHIGVGYSNGAWSQIFLQK